MPTLAKYRKMRDFERTREPRGKGSAPRKAAPRAATGLSYVIQKHAARNLHYDFRLELDGVLLSWAVPKGPSLDPSVKRLAMEVEPHPLEYGGFEGTIPKGEYGGGTVMVWDRGSWQPQGDPHAGIAKGHLSFTLSGDKLQGAWHLVRTQRFADDGHGNKQGKAWLLFKSRDDAARAGADLILNEAPDSALSGRDLDQIAAEEGEASDAPDSSKRPKKALKKAAAKEPAAAKKSAAKEPAAAKKPAAKKPAAKKPAAKKPAAKKPAAKKPAAKKPVAARKAVGTKSQLPSSIAPELATLVDAAPAGDDWLHEIKLDGYRVLARVDHGQVALLTRNGKDWTERMPGLERALSKLDVESAFFDGELVALNEQGVSDFQTLQNSLNAHGDAGLVYYAFDLLHLNGRELTQLPLTERKAELASVLDDGKQALAGAVRFSAHVVGNGPQFFENACKLGLEGAICKRAASTYRSGRGKDWLKVKCSKRQEFTIVGYSEPGGSRSHLGALLLGVERDGALVYAGKVGTGFSQKSLQELHERLAPLERKRPAVSNPPRGADARGVHWVKPELVAEIGFTEMTGEGLLRHPTFHGLRDDKPAADVKLETATRLAPASSSDYQVTHPLKVLYPEQGITKQEVLDYYALVAERMLPHIANRPLTLVRCPNGFGKPCFFQKHPGKGVPEGLRAISIREKEGKAPYSVIDDAQGLFGLVQLGALEVHTWGSRADDFEHPDILVFDLDPDPSVEYAAVIRAAHWLREVFEQAKLETFVKTTGGKGLHVCLPIAPDLAWDTVKAFSGRVAQAIAAQHPEQLLATVSKAQRKGRIFIDYLRNGRGATFIAPYSTRAREGAPIAVPLEWDELSPKLPPSHFNVRNVQTRLAKLRTDPFERMPRLKQRLRPEQIE